MSNRPETHLSSLHFAVAGILGAVIGFAISPNNLYALAPGLVLLGLALFGRYPHLGFFTIVFLFPFGAYRGKIHWVIGAALLAIACLHYLPRKKWPRQLRSNLWPWFGAFIAVNLASACLSPYPQAAFENLALVIAGGLFVALGLLFLSPHDLRRVLPLVIVVSITLGSLLAVAGYVFDISLFAQDIEGFKRGVGATVSPNSLALFIVSVIPFLFYYLLKARRLPLYLLCVLAIVINLAGIVTSYSRGGFWIMLLIAVASLVEFRDQWRVRHAGTLGLCIGLYLLLTVVLVPGSPVNQGAEEKNLAAADQLKRKPGSAAEKRPSEDIARYWKRQQSLSDSTDFSISRRRNYLLVGWEAFLRRPVLGFGPTTFKYLYEESPRGQELLRRRERKNQKVAARVAHNTYLEVLVGSGATGLLFFLGLVGTALWNFARAKREVLLKGDLDTALLVAAYRLSFLSMLVYFGIQSMVNHKPFLLLLAASQAALAISRGESVDRSAALTSVC